MLLKELKRVGRGFLDAALPPLCLSCGEIVAEPGALCTGCWASLMFISPPCCTRCGDPFAFDIGPDALCAACLARPPRYRRARAVVAYDQRSRRLVLPLKHGDRTDMAPTYGRWMARAGAELLADAELVVPVPLHWRRLFTRRYNQSALLARSAARAADRTFAPDLLCRLRWTGSQAGLKAQERRRNVRQAFAVTGRWASRVKGVGIVLVDDVLTTGATVDACTRVLLAAGARHVDILTLARVVRSPI